MPSTCDFQLNKPNAVYYSGETVSGTIILNTTTNKDVRGVSILFRGEGKVSWSETERRRRSNGSYENHTVYYKSNEVYVDNCTSVSGEGTLPAGTHTYNFHIQLPLQCPTSCEGRHGQVRYELTLQVIRPFRFDNVFSKPLSVIKIFDLNMDPSYRFPIAIENMFSPCCWSCTGGTINATLTVPFGGYAVGQSVKYSLHIENQRMDDIEGYTIEFKRLMTFIAHQPRHKTREDKTVMYKKTYDSQCLRLTTRIFEGEFIIPSTPPTTQGQHIILVEYYLKVDLHISGCSSDENLSIPLVIGTIPLRESLMPPPPSQPTAAYTENDQFLGIRPTAPDIQMDDNGGNDMPPSYQQLAPPSFEEATRCSTPFVDTDKIEHHRHIGFRPLYPSYSVSDE